VAEAGVGVGEGLTVELVLVLVVFVRFVFWRFLDVDALDFDVFFWEVPLLRLLVSLWVPLGEEDDGGDGRDRR
jgi:hypothetical protein